MKIRAISLWRPWADWILLGWKTVETRTHNRFKGLEGERIAICASKKWDPWATHAARLFLSPNRISMTDMRRGLPIGGHVICTALVAQYAQRLDPGMGRRALIECNTERAGLFLVGVQQVRPAIPVVGRQGIFTIELPEAV